MLQRHRSESYDKHHEDYASDRTKFLRWPTMDEEWPVFRSGHAVKW